MPQTLIFGPVFATVLLTFLLGIRVHPSHQFL